MFAYLIGRVAGVTEDNLVLEVGQIGFNVKIPASLPSLLPPVGGEVKIYTYTCVREDAFQLYGFLSQDELDMFRLLITVSGIGPKGGLAILSVLSADDVRLAVLTQDAKAIARAPGVGPKTAQRLILELKDKISMEDTFVSGESEAYAAGTSGLTDARREAAEALAALGYSAAEAAQAVRKVEHGDEMDVEELLKAALKHLF
ncbi:MAG TPA: Holliday junction branch migration protein RuvA [Candidatus Eisenbergiella pullistercoris]|uniref:Holliday junction branch migration complex subunit RuvA n=1 Tax=Candidatus Eisenbergiella pullistercoris TaxID=2838555 RepID=A0A9D1YQG6_9FIRM|nr:Holliday junction branch migration protein RuvA [Candidatus Eisenbergiella pullistercoris]